MQEIAFHPIAAAFLPHKIAFRQTAATYCNTKKTYGKSMA